MDMIENMIVLAQERRLVYTLDSVKKAIQLRQRIYGRKKLMMKHKMLDPGSFEVKLLDKDELPIQFASLTYKADLAAGRFSPTYLIMQPQDIGVEEMLSKDPNKNPLLSLQEQGLLPSQQTDKAVTEMFAAKAENAPSSDPFNPSIEAAHEAMAALGFGKPKR